MDMSALLLSRLQFVWVIGWHILLPAFTVGMASYIALLETLYFKTRRPIYQVLANYWIRIFATAFVVLGVGRPPIGVVPHQVTGGER